jgi:uncharacterized membrane protein YebE (DUF533 family)
MSIADILHSGEDHAKAKSHIRNLVRIACADGHMDDAEYKLLLRIARKYQLSEDDVKEIIEKADSLAFTPPATKEERYIQLWNLGRMVMADGVEDKAETEKVATFAVGLGFPGAIIDDLVQEVIKIVKAKSFEDDAVEQIDRFMKSKK